MTKANYLSKDQNWQDETTIYWFECSGEFEGLYGVAESCGELSIVDNECVPLDEGNYDYRKLSDVLIVSDMMRQA